MSYVPLGDGRSSPYVEIIEFTTKNPVQATYNDAPPQSPPYDGGTNHSDSKAHFPPDKVVDNWPVQSQQVAAMTPLRGTIFAFDVVLASSPLMFIGMLCCMSL